MSNLWKYFPSIQDNSPPLTPSRKFSFLPDIIARIFIIKAKIKAHFCLSVLRVRVPWSSTSLESLRRSESAGVSFWLTLRDVVSPFVKTERKKKKSLPRFKNNRSKIFFRFITRSLRNGNVRVRRTETVFGYSSLGGGSLFRGQLGLEVKGPSILKTKIASDVCGRSSARWSCGDEGGTGSGENGEIFYQARSKKYNCNICEIP